MTKALRWWPGILFGLLYGCLGPTAGEVALPDLNREVEAALAFPAGKALAFAVHADSYDNAGGNYVMLDVTLVRKGQPVARMACAGFELEGGAGCGSGATHLNGDCAIVVPEGGSDAIRITATLADPLNSASFEGLAVYLRD